MAIATSEYWKDKVTGERKDKTEWHRTVIFNDKLAEIAEKYVRKGSKVLIEGQLQTRKWINNEGKEQYSTEIVVSQFKGELVLMDNKNDTSTDPTTLGTNDTYAHSSATSFANSATQPDSSIPYPYNSINTSTGSSSPAGSSPTSPFSPAFPSTVRSASASSSSLDDDIPF